MRVQTRKCAPWPAGYHPGVTGTNVKITINGREYSSLDEVPEEMRHLIQDRIATAMASAATTGDPGFAPQPQLLTPAEYRRQIESQQSGRAPEAFQGERGLGIALWAIIALSAAGLATGYSIPVLFFTIAFSTLGLIGLWYRRQNRALYPVPLDLANAANSSSRARRGTARPGSIPQQVPSVPFAHRRADRVFVRAARDSQPVGTPRLGDVLAAGRWSGCGVSATCRSASTATWRASTSIATWPRCTGVCDAIGTKTFSNVSWPTPARSWTPPPSVRGRVDACAHHP